MKRLKKRFLKAVTQLRDALVLKYGALLDEAQLAGTKIFFADEAHFRADGDLRRKWVLKM